MAETIKIEIPVSVQDKTDPSLSNITRKLNSMAQASQKVSKMMMGGTAKKTGLDRSIEKLSQSLKREHQIEIRAHDSATPVLSDVEDRAAHVSGASAEIEISAENNASGVMADAEDALTAFDGNSGVATVDADGNAVEQIAEAEDALAGFDGTSGTASVDADGNAVEQISEAEDALAGYDGSTGTSEIEADDQASDIISSIADLVTSIDGLTAVVSVEARDNTGGVLSQYQSGGGGSGGGLSMPSSGFSVPAAASGYAAAKSGLLGAAGFAGLSLGIGSALSAFSSFESGMSEVKAISGATEAQFQSLTEKAKYMGSTTKFTATESAEAFKYMAMAGWKPDQMEASIEGIMNLAAASGESLGTTSDIVTDALTAFGIETTGFTKNGVSNVTHFADVLAQAASNSNTNVGIMGESFKYAAPMMGAMGYSAEDTAIALGLMANAGIKGSMAGTTLRKAISNLSAPTKAMQTAMDKYGISLRDETGNMRTLKGVMDNVREALGGLAEDEQAAAVKSIFGQTAMSGMMAIINSEEDAYNSLTESIYDADGASERMKNTMLDNLSGDMTLMSSAWEGVQDTFGERVAPHIRSIVQAITDAMPGLSDAINNAFDDIDPLVDGFKTKVGNMLSSEEWKNADGTDKINIAWDTLIADPFKTWIADEGATTIGDAVRGLFEEAFKIVPGGEEAGLTSWLSAGLIGFGAVKLGGLASHFSELAASVSEMAGAGTILGDFAGGLSSVAGPAILAAAGIGAIALAIKSYNDAKIEENLADKFGDIELTAEQTKALAEQILDIPYTANLKTSKVQFDEADDLMSKAETALETNKKINWKVNSIHLDITPEDGQSLIDNMDTFTQSIQEAFTNKEYGAEEAVKGILGAEASTGLISEMQSWFKADQAQLAGMSSAITGILQEALDTGAYDVNAEAAIQIMQQKMLQIANATREARQRAQLDYLKLTASGAALSPDSWRAVITEMDLMRENMKLDEKETYTDLLEYFETALANKHIDQPRFDAIMGMLKQSMDSSDVRALGNEWSWISESLKDAYGGEIETATAAMDKDFESRWENVESVFAGIGVLHGPEEMKRMLEDTNTFMDTGLNSTTAGALLDRYEAILPTVQEMQEMIDSHFEVDENGVRKQISEVPESLMAAYNEAVEIGAAGGNVDAMWAAMANRLVSSGGYDDFMAKVEETGAIIPEGFATALERAAATTVEDADFSEMWNSLSEAMNTDGSVDLLKVNEWLEKYGQSIQEYLDGKEIDAEGKIKISPGQISEDMDSILGSMDGMDLAGAQMQDGVLYRNYTIKPGYNLTQISEENGIDMDQILMDNPEITNPNEVEANQVIKIRLSEAEIEAGDWSAMIEDSFSDAIAESGSSAEVTAEGLVVTLGDVEVDDKSAVEQVADALNLTMEQLATATGMTQEELETSATITLKDVVFDTSALETATEETPDIGETNVTGTANADMEYGETNGLEEARSQMEEDADEMFADPYNTDQTTVNANAVYGSDNGTLASAYQSFASAAKEAFSTPVDVPATVNVNAVPSGGGVSGAAGNANGSYVDGPLLSWVGEDGPEFIIPVGHERRNRGIELWQQAGEALGVPGFADGGLVGGIPVSSSWGDSDEEEGNGASGERISSDISNNNGGVTVQINLSPEFNLNDANENNVLAMIRAHMKELADDLGYEISEMLNEAYENRPVA